MIPHRVLSKQVFANDLKDRVTACRKRLRLNRKHRIHFDNQVEELFCEIAIQAASFCDHSEEGFDLRESLAHVGDGPSQLVGEHNEQEVGIT